MKQREAVYASTPFAPEWPELAIFALVFDRLHFPGVHLPPGEVEMAEILAERERLQIAVKSGDMFALYRYNLLGTFSLKSCLDPYCAFATAKQATNAEETEIQQLSFEMDSAFFGPAKEGFSPSVTMSFSTRVPGIDADDIWAPGPFAYPAYALLYAQKYNLPLVHGEAAIPLIRGKLPSVRPSSEAVATMIALQAVEILLPKLRDLNPSQILYMRSELEALMVPLRQEILKLAGELQLALRVEADAEDIRCRGEVIVKTRLEPMITDLVRQLRDATRPWYAYFHDIVVGSGLGVSFWQFPATHLAAIPAAASIALAKAASVQREQAVIRRSPLYFFVKAGQLLDRASKTS